MTPDSPELQAYKEKAKQSANQWLLRWTLLLKAKGIKRIHVSYSGSGDDGGIEIIACSKYAVKDVWLELRKVLGVELADRFESVIYDIITHHGAGFCDDGCSGTVEWDITQDTFVHNLSNNVMTTDDRRFEGVDALSGYVDPEGA